MVGVTAGEFVAVLVEFEDGADGVAILCGEGPFPGAAAFVSPLKVVKGARARAAKSNMKRFITLIL